jgi:hypothetical protein
LEFGFFLLEFSIVTLSEVEELEAIPAIRSNLLCRTPAQKDFHFYQG